MSAFSKGDKVAWSHQVATQHTESSVMLKDAVSASDGAARFGVVKGVANKEGTYFTVDFDGDEKVLTQDELVKVAA